MTTRKASAVSEVEVAGLRRDVHGIVHRAIYIGTGYGQFMGLVCSQLVTPDLEYEDDDEIVSCLSCLAAGEP